MRSLKTDQRNYLQKCVEAARDIAEKAAHISLESIAVSQPSFYTHMNETEKDLRRQLRSQGRQLGDKLDQNGHQTLDNLIEKVAYEHWHRMLFAKFLAVNNLLMHPELNIPLSLQECDDLAISMNMKNGWELAAKYASIMLPQIFDPQSPILLLDIPIEDIQKMEQLIEQVPDEIFMASDSLGWVYQFWQSRRKEEVNASEVKIGARELPAVTQLFTEPYMVSYLLDNTLGAWWANKILSIEDTKYAKSENELRKKGANPGIDLKYLRFYQKEDKMWTPSTGSYEKWPEALSELRILDPCCGSGHFLVAAFEMLVPMRMVLEGLTEKEAVDSVLRDNIHGLEIDQRCVEIAVFALALAAWKYPNAGGYRSLPRLNIACTGVPIRESKNDWISIAGKDVNLRYVLGKLYDQFSDAPILGSLVNPLFGLNKSSLSGVTYEKVSPYIEDILGKYATSETTNLGIIAQGISEATRILTSKYHLIITNVPYLGLGKQDDKLVEHIETHYPSSKNDLSTVFLERCLEFCTEGGTCSLVLPQNWLFLTSYQKLREKLLTNTTWKSNAWLGPGAFEAISGEVVQAILFVLNKEKPVESSIFMGIDVSDCSGSGKKAKGLITNSFNLVEQYQQLKNPKSIVSKEVIDNEKALSKYMDTSKGICTGDSPRFIQYFWEQNNTDDDWNYFRTSVNSTNYYSGMEKKLYWQKGQGELIKYVKERLGGNIGAWIRGHSAWGKKGISLSRVSGLSASLYCGELSDDNAAVLIPNEKEDLIPLWSYCSKSIFEENVRKVNQKMSVDNAYLKIIPFEKSKWSLIAEKEYPHGLPMPFTNDPTQWIFHGHPCETVEWNETVGGTHKGSKRIDKSVLQIAVARLVGYKWPSELDTEIELDKEMKDIIGKVRTLELYCDRDGIVCIPPIRGEIGAEERLESLLSAAYGDAWAQNTLDNLMACSDHKGKTLGSWLRDKFFQQHCKLFNNRPFIWHIWDGLKDGFSALVNYHKLDLKLFETLIYTYLGDWIVKQQQEVTGGIDGAEERLVAAEVLKDRLELILEGEAPYDIFVRWKALDEQPTGWDPDLNDGVRLNIRPFMMVPDVNKKGAGVLRDKPNIHWKKDRGRDVKSAPWYNLGLDYGGKEGDRINDHHLTLEQKGS